MWPTSCHVSTLAQVRFWPEATHFASVQVPIVSHELNPIHFLTFEISINILVPESHSTPITLKNVRIQLSRNSTKFVWVTRFHEKSNIEFRFVIRDLEIYRFSTYTIIAIYRFALFSEKFDFSRVLQVQFYAFWWVNFFSKIDLIDIFVITNLWKVVHKNSF